MSGTTDETKGRVKKAAGEITGDDELREEGKVDKAKGEVKDKIEGAVDKVGGILKGGDKDKS